MSLGVAGAGEVVGTLSSTMLACAILIMSRQDAGTSSWCTVVIAKRAAATPPFLRGALESRITDEMLEKRLKRKPAALFDHFVGQRQE
jgi:hypothetical protein